MDSDLTTRETVELFHLHFLRVLTTGADKSLYVVKGGCNLRFFLGSPRYSEDLDVDVGVIAKGTLGKNVEKALASAALRTSLARSHVELHDVSAPKQTDTTQRWKIGLVALDGSVTLRTKLEFSRRKRAEECAVDPIDANVAGRYQMVRLLLAHYRAREAFVQKVRALIGRTEPQARDVFDLHLIASTAGSTLALPSELRGELPAALDRVVELSYDAYRSQVVAYLAADVAAEYGSRAFFDQMQDEVVRTLQDLGE